MEIGICKQGCIAIPHTTKPYKPRPKPEEEVIEVEENTISSEESVSNLPAENAMNAYLPPSDDIEIAEEICEEVSFNVDIQSLPFPMPVLEDERRFEVDIEKSIR